MTRAQEAISKYIYNNFYYGSVRLIPEGDDKIKLIDEKGESMTLTLNCFGDIMDAGTKKVYAFSGLPHDLNPVGPQIPRNWKAVHVDSTQKEPGVISVAPNYYIGAVEVMNYLGCKENKAYEIIRGLRDELINAGRMYPGVPKGRVPKKYFLERCMIEE